jgi:hypothetical protein
MKRMLLAACGLALVAALAGCGSATDNLNFKVPQGYETKLNLFGNAMWIKGTDKNAQILWLMKLPVKVDDSKLYQNFDPSSLPSGGVKNATISQREKITICGDHPAFFMKATGHSTQNNQNIDENIEMLMTAWNGSTYLTMYMYPQGRAPEPDAEAAIRSVCLKS